MKRLYLLFIVLGIFISTSFAEEKPVKIACVGNSITYGSLLENPAKDSYPGVLEQMLGKGYDVRNFGVSGRTMLNKGDFPYMREKAFFDALKFNPDIVTIKLGTNDSKPFNWVYKSEFVHDVEEMIHAFSSLSSKPRIILCLPVPAIPGGDNINDENVKNEIIPMLKKVAAKHKIETLDLYLAMKPYYPTLFPDGVHPNAEGASIMAGFLYKKITGNNAPQLSNPGRFPGKKSDWNGYEKYDFVCAGREATVVVPKVASPGKPWIWRPAFFGAFPSVDIELLKEGFHVAYYDLTHLYGSPKAMSLGDVFYNRMVNNFGLSSKVTLEGFSRGGLCAINWATHNPNAVACIYVDAPVCDLTSWPGRERTDLWNDMLKEFDVTDKEVTSSFRGNAFSALSVLVKNNIPIIAVCGDSDKVVPYENNMKVLRDRYSKMGGVVEVILKHGCDHHPHSLENPEAIVDFIKRYQVGDSKYSYISHRGSLANSFNKFIETKKGNVAFLGGSITEMRGWRNMIQEDLKQRFPYTEFCFTDAGIGSTGSTPHAFRFENDVLEHGIPDLLFVEAAVNDHTNGFGPSEQVKGMEGIIRHALSVNPEMDIIMLHFIYDPFIEMYNENKRPDVVLNHERVANHYNISSIDLIHEVCDRMKDRLFTWEEFGGTHPSWYGHKFYAASINRLFDMEQRSLGGNVVKAHSIPEKPLESYCYDKGRFLNIDNAYSLKGFEIVDDWKPVEQIETRKGFFDVSMLVSREKGASFKLDFNGTAIGIFCVSGPDAGIIEFRIDNGEWKTLDTKTQWSSHLYIPWLFVLDDELADGNHTLDFRMSKESNAGCWIRNFVVNLGK